MLTYRPSQEHFGVLDRIEHRMGRTALDVLVKILYSIILLSSNIYILDVVADVRMIQVHLPPDTAKFVTSLYPVRKNASACAEHIVVGSSARKRVSRSAHRSGRKW
jgi:hypothetical protein